MFYNCLSAWTELCWTCSLEKRCTHISTPSFTNVDMVIFGKKQKLCVFCPSFLKILSKEFQRFLAKKYSKCRIWTFLFWHFPSIFVLLKVTCLVTLFDNKLHVVKNSPNQTIFGNFNEFGATQNVNATFSVIFKHRVNKWFWTFFRPFYACTK